MAGGVAGYVKFLFTTRRGFLDLMTAGATPVICYMALLLKKETDLLREENAAIKARTLDIMRAKGMIREQ